ncbi:hypothetical protein DERP_007695 [Dermatophagoides pteronyssinus]|uniref:Uncharacterized protein n=1 Tax=Dermatophagoides pteronyssinus TaxID=6956 RepID=A0ABQ8JLA6_DERPT|nr:hypothetical protein DERP_007695 [Dermatophagoides pteronyssinus]
MMSLVVILSSYQSNNNHYDSDLKQSHLLSNNDKIEFYNTMIYDSIFIFTINFYILIKGII